MRHGKYLIILLVTFLQVQLFAQTTSTENIDITGLWKGVLYNDSTKQDYKYEIGISEEKGKLTGFSHTWYNDKDYFVVKKIKVKRTDGKIIIEDVDIVAYNYPESPPKGVKRLHVLTLQVKDSMMELTGEFTTNRTKTYAPATGTIKLQRRNDYWRQSDLMAHLQELGLDNKMSFVIKDNEIAKAAEERSLTKTETLLEKQPLSTTEKKPTTTVKSSGTKKVEIAAILKANVGEQKPAVTVMTPVPVKRVVVNKAEPAAEVLLRKNIVQETMYFKTDSLELALYDNGEVDGDTVSVLMNGTVIMAKQGLSTQAIRKSIQIPAGMDSVELVMYAENLGTLPPNSGLLVVRDGKEIYEIRFSGDLQKNAAIILKRRKN